MNLVQMSRSLRLFLSIVIGLLLPPALCPPALLPKPEILTFKLDSF